jgi:5-methylcytosine-specific restriction endonuclease McrA
MSELSWEKIKQQVIDRANGCCEYCRSCVSNMGQIMPVDHIDPNGGNTLENLCLACWNCNNSKYEATSAVDPETKKVVGLFNPRTQIWSEHFQWIENGIYLRGLTSIGRATVERLKMNRDITIEARRRWVASGHHPPV